MPSLKPLGGGVNFLGSGRTSRPLLAVGLAQEDAPFPARAPDSPAVRRSVG